MIGATRLAAKALLEHAGAISRELKEHLEQLIAAERTSDHLTELDAVQALHSVLTNQSPLRDLSYGEAVQGLVEVVWHYIFMYYHLAKRWHSDNTQSANSQQQEGT
jgi:hypothetical protein